MNQIVENPSNINLENITGILKQNNKWIIFEYMDLTFRGYIFRDNGNAIIIFFPANTLFQELSEVIKIFLFFSLFSLLFYVKDVRKIDWKSIYYSYSIRVFSFLILISLLTAVVFSIFFINFSYQSSEQKVMRMVYENGRTAGDADAGVMTIRLSNICWLMMLVTNRYRSGAWQQHILL